jgi:hypothetical protein
VGGAQRPFGERASTLALDADSGLGENVDVGVVRQRTRRACGPRWLVLVVAPECGRYQQDDCTRDTEKSPALERRQVFRPRRLTSTAKPFTVSR